MSALPRHILGRLLVAFLLTAWALTIILCAGLTLRLVTDEGLQLVQLPPLLLHVAMRGLSVTLPLAVLTGTILTYGRLSADREFQAAQWCGVHPVHLLWPGIVLGACSGVLAWIANDLWIPKSQYALERSLEQSRAELALVRISMGERDASFRGAPLSSDRTEESERPLFHLHVRDPRPGGVLHDIHLFELDSEQGYRAQGIHYSPKGRIDHARSPARVRLTLEGLDSIRLAPDGSVASRTASGPADPFRYTFALTPPPQRIDRRQLDSGQLLAQVEDNPTLEPRARRQHRQEHVERRAMAGASLAFALLGIPLGLYGRRGNFFVGLSLSLALVFGLYYPAMLLGRAVSADTWTSCYLALWAPAALMAAIALALLRRVLRGNV